MNILVIAAHPDDEILGVGGTLCRHVSNGDDVYVCIVTKAYEPNWTKEYINNKIKEQNELDDFLHIKKRFNLNLETVRLNILPYGEINKKISKIVEEVKPNIIYTHHENDLNYDHKLVFRASLVASRPPKKIKLLCFETLSGTEWSNKPFQPNIWINIGEYIEKKIKAFEIYKSEVKDYPHPRSSQGIKILAMKRGLEICEDYAEAFILVREILI